MKKIQPNLFPLFSTPFLRVDFPNCSKINAELKNLFLKLSEDKAKYENKEQHNYVQDKLFESNFDIFDLNVDSIKVIKRFIDESIRWIAASTNELTREELSKLNLYYDAWFHISDPGSYFYTHNHPMASWSAVYCIDDGRPDIKSKDSGVLRFHDPRPHNNCYIDNANYKLSGIYSNRNYNFKLKPGNLIVFPSYLQHEVSPHVGEGKRITLAVNAWSDRYGSIKERYGE